MSAGLAASAPPNRGGVAVTKGRLPAPIANAELRMWNDAQRWPHLAADDSYPSTGPIPAEVVQALLTAERAKAKAVGTVVSLPGVPENGPIDQAETGDLTRRVAELERAVTEQDREFRRQLADRDTIIDELRSERRQLRQALASLMQGLGHLIGDGD